MEKEIPHANKYVIFLGESGFPKGLAAIQRMTIMGRSLLHSGCNVKVVCRKGKWSENDQTNFGPVGTYKGIDYIYTSGTVFRPKKFIPRNIRKIKGIFREYRYLKGLKSQVKLDVALVSCMNSLHVFRYWVFSRLIGFPIILNFVELGYSMNHRRSIAKRINDYILGLYLVRIVDGALPISEKLMDYYRTCSPSKPILKLPILCDFDQFQNKPLNNSGVCLLYCGAASYYELINFVIEAFDQIKDPEESTSLALILGGSEDEIEKVRVRIEQAANKRFIRLTTNVAHREIPEYYARASALLIPLRPTLQDAARFPHKIGEYLASGRPMITTAFGEINHYDFIDGETALVAPDYDTSSYAEKMEFVIDHPQVAAQIGLRGREMGLENFDYRKHGQRLSDFLVSLNQRSHRQKRKL